MKKWRNYAIVLLVLAVGSGIIAYNYLRTVPAISELPDLRGAAPAASGDTYTKPAAALAGMQPVTNNGKLSLYYDPETMAVAVMDAAGAVWRSNPEKAGEDELANAAVKEQLNSQFILRYSNKKGQQSFKNSYADSVMLKQATAEPIEGGLKVTYLVGKATSGIDALPRQMNAERYQSLILDKVGDKYQRYLFAAYKNDANPDVYVRNDKQLTGLALNKVKQAFEEAGYTEEDLALDNAEGGAAAEKEVFTVPVAYTLQGDQFVARVLTQDVQYPDSFPLTQITLLPYFGAADLQDEGYLFVPDGSGSLIRLNNGKQRYEAYEQPVYGDDGGTWDGEIDDDPTIEPIRLPVYGAKKNDQAFIAIIDEGAAVATIHGEVSRAKSAYNSVYPSFQLLAQERVNLSAISAAKDTKSKEVFVFQQRPTYADFSVRYAFLSGDKANYAGMAAYYRDYLERNQVLTKAPAQATLPFYLEVVGGIPKRRSVLGVPYTALVPLTTFDQTQTILGALKQEGIDNLKVRLNGWFNNGVSHSVAAKIKIDGSLGGSGGYKDLIAYANAEGIQLFPDVSFTHLYDVKGNGRYTESKAVSRYVTRNAAWVWERTEWARPLSARFVPRVVDAFLDAYAKYGKTGISVRNIGYQLEGDYRRNHVVDRAQAEEIYRQQLEKIGAQLPDIMVDGGNAYTLPYAKDVVRAPMASNGYNLTDESVPFYQMVLHGYVGYTGHPFNLSAEGDLQKYVLQSLEYGSNVYFEWIYADNDEVKETLYQYLYSVNYKTWLKQASEAYRTINEALKDVQDQPIADHRKLQDGVYQTTFAGGKTIVVNYNQRAVTVGGHEIEARDFFVGGKA